MHYLTSFIVSTTKIIHSITYYFSPVRLMKLSSINLNHLIATGAAIFYISLGVFVVRPQNKIAITVLCNVSH